MAEPESAPSRRRRQCRTLVLTLAGVLPVVTVAGPSRPLLLWNVTNSSPAGLYGVSGKAGIEAGDIVIARPPAGAGKLAARRRYLPAGVPLVKPVAAVAGDCVCARGPFLSINGRVAAIRQRTDRSGRPLPWWSGCERLAPGSLLLLSAESPDAFDGRYFGPSSAIDIIGRARLLWRG